MKTIHLFAAILLLCASAMASADCGGELELAAEDNTSSPEQLDSKEAFFGEQSVEDVLATILPY